MYCKDDIDVDNFEMSVESNKSFVAWFKKNYNGYKLYFSAVCNDQDKYHMQIAT